jgi:formylglycine-generating enzyme required for sulfatase activity
MKKLLFVSIAILMFLGAWIAPMVSSQSAMPTDDLSLTIPGTGKAQLKMRLIPAGSFLMGSPGGETDSYDDEAPQHQVTISKSFYMGIYEVTQVQWAAVMGTRPSGFGYIADNPVEQVSWDDCQKFIQKLNTMGLGTFRLPTEAEWEYACRAGSTTRFPWGEDPSYNLIGQYAWYSSNSSSKTQTVGLQKPNAWGLFDMNGNVYEWCSDWYASYGAEKQTDPKGPTTGSGRVIRGGGWSIYPQYCRSANRDDDSPSSKFDNLGFRLVRMVP